MAVEILLNADPHSS